MVNRASSSSGACARAARAPPLKFPPPINAGDISTKVFAMYLRTFLLDGIWSVLSSVEAESTVKTFSIPKGGSISEKFDLFKTNQESIMDNSSNAIPEPLKFWTLYESPGGMNLTG